MSTTPDTPPDAAPAPVETPPPAADESADGTAADTDPDELPEDQAVFDRGYVEKVRRESQKYRTERNELQEKLKQYEVFEQYEPEDLAVWKQLATTWQADPNAAATMFQNIAQGVLGDGSDPGGDVAAAQSIEDSMSNLDTPDDLTPDKVQSMIDSAMQARENAAAERTAVEGIYSEMREAGVDPKSRDGMAVLWSANNETEGDIAKAIENVKADRQRVIDEYVNGASTGGVTAPSGGVVASSDQPIQNLDDARKAADAFIRSQIGASSGESS